MTIKLGYATEITITNVYAPTADKEEDEQKEFYDEVEKTIYKTHEERTNYNNRRHECKNTNKK